MTCDMWNIPLKNPSSKFAFSNRWFRQVFKISTYIQCEYSNDRMIQNLVPVRFKELRFYGLSTPKFEPIN